ncbi:MAG: hypothetical protein ACTSYS_04405 [Promethearchaeota archaeon]
MSQDISLEDLVRKIVMETGLSREDILKQIDEAVDEVNGLMTRVGAAFILAEKLNVKIDINSVSNTGDPDNDFIPLNKVTEGMRAINVVGRVINLSSVRKFNRSDGRVGSVSSFTIQDKFGKVKVVLWGVKANLTESSIKIGEIISILNGYTKRGLNGQVEVHVGSKSLVKPKPDFIDESSFPRIQVRTVKLNEISEENSPVNVKVKVINKIPVKTFQKRDGSQGQVAKAMVGDETGNTSIVFWTNSIKNHARLNVGSTYLLENVKVKKNNYTNQLELQFESFSNIKSINEAINVKMDTPIDTPVNSQGTSDNASIIEDYKKILMNQKIVNVKGKVILKNDVREWNKNGRSGKVSSIMLQDSLSQSIRIVFWNDDVDLLKDVDIGDIIVVKNAYPKLNRNVIELNFGKSGSLEKIGKENVEPIMKKIGDIKPNQVYISFQGRVKKIEEEKVITLNDGSEAKLINFIVGDETGLINVVAWRDLVDEIKNYKVGDAIGFENVRTRFNDYRNMVEVSLTRNTRIYKPDPSTVPDLQEIPEIPTPQEVIISTAKRITINDIEDGLKCEILGYITHVSNFVNYYLACPKCNKKVVEVNDEYSCNVHGKVQPIKRLIAKVTIDDGNGSLGVTLIGENADKLFGINHEEKEKLLDPIEKSSIIGEITEKLLLKPFVFSGNIKYNNYRQEFEMIVNHFSSPDFEEETENIVISIEKEA